MRIIVDHDLCESNAVCVGEAPEVFGLDESNGMVVLTETARADHLALVRRAVDRCPRAALSLEED
jgi:ferredoxin